jgi:hypothetical protein
VQHRRVALGPPKGAVLPAQPLAHRPEHPHHGLVQRGGLGQGAGGGELDLQPALDALLLGDAPLQLGGARAHPFLELGVEPLDGALGLPARGDVPHQPAQRGHRAVRFQHGAPGDRAAEALAPGAQEGGLEGLHAAGRRPERLGQPQPEGAALLVDHVAGQGVMQELAGLAAEQVAGGAVGLHDVAGGRGHEVGVGGEVEQVAVAALLGQQAALGDQQLLVLLAQLLLGDLDLLDGHAQLLDGDHQLGAFGVAGQRRIGQVVDAAAQRLDVVDEVQDAHASTSVGARCSSMRMMPRRSPWGLTRSLAVTRSNRSAP